MTDKRELKDAVGLLAASSETARRLMESGCIRCEPLLTGLDQCEPEELYKGSPTFHPNGRSGCILMEDCYFLDIRCDHLVWTEGWLEPTDDLVDGSLSKRGSEFPAVMILGNHKGCLYVRLLYGAVRDKKPAKKPVNDDRTTGPEGYEKDWFMSFVDTEATKNENLRNFIRDGLGGFGKFTSLVRKYGVEFKEVKRNRRLNSVKAGDWIKSLRYVELKLPVERIRELALLRTDVYPSTYMVRSVQAQYGIESMSDEDWKRMCYRMTEDLGPMTGAQMNAAALKMLNKAVDGIKEKGGPDPASSQLITSNLDDLINDIDPGEKHELVQYITNSISQYENQLS